MLKELEDKRKEEIIEACIKVYETKSFKEITIKDIGEATSFSRTSIYNYFQTKEEIFLELFKREYNFWIYELEEILKNNEHLSKDEFAKLLSKSIENRKNMLKLLSMNMYDLEENSRMELLIDFKVVFGKSMETVKKCLDKFFVNMTEKEKTEFIYSFFPFMYGIYPYTMVTDRQKEAMQLANLEYEYMSIYEITYKMLKKLLDISKCSIR